MNLFKKKNRQQVKQQVNKIRYYLICDLIQDNICLNLHYSEEFGDPKFPLICKEILDQMLRTYYVVTDGSLSSLFDSYIGVGEFEKEWLPRSCMIYGFKNRISLNSLNAIDDFDILAVYEEVPNNLEIQVKSKTIGKNDLIEMIRLICMCNKRELSIRKNIM